MTLSIAGSYLRSEISGGYTAFNYIGQVTNFDGTDLPYTPEWNVSANGRYEWPVSNNLNAFVAANITYQSESYSDLGEFEQMRIKPYSLTDIQAGVEADDGKWRAYFWGRNIFNTYYWYNTARLMDTIARNAGMPATYGVTVSYSY